MAEPLPEFTNTTVFPTFLTIPEYDPDPSSAPGRKWYLLAQVKDNMTINKPTLVLTDRDGNPFALVFEGLGRDDLDLKGLGFKKGVTAVIPNATRTKPADEGKRGFVRIEKGGAGGVRAVPGPLAKVLELGGKTEESRCGTCGKEGKGEGEGEGEGEAGKGLRSCTGCERVGYCSKDCQVKGWNDRGHKSDCKVFKALDSIFR